MASDTSSLYTGRALDLGSCPTNYGYGNYCQKPSQWYLGFWTEAGVYTNSHGSSLQRTGGGNAPHDRFFPGTGNSFLLGNLQNPKFNMNQMGLFLERKMNTSCGFDWGFKTQMMFGTDAYLTQSHEDFSFDHNWRSGDYYTSVSDLYVSVGYRKLAMKVGKFASPLSYEHAESPNNFFYSHSYGFLQSPDTHTGFLLDYRHHCRLSFFGGWTTGSDAGWDNRFDDSAVLGGFRYKLWDGGNLSYGMQYAKLHGGTYNGELRYSKMFFDRLGAGENMDAYYHSVVFTQDLGCRWDYAAEWYLMKTSNYSDALLQSGNGKVPFSRYGIAQYLTYQLTCKVALGLRAEWMRDNSYDADFYAATFGVNWTPVQCLVVRPEIRYDWHNGNGTALFNNNSNREQLSGGIAAMYKF